MYDFPHFKSENTTQKAATLASSRSSLIKSFLRVKLSSHLSYFLNINIFFY